MVDPVEQRIVDEAAKERESQWRHAALGHACHDMKGGSSPIMTVARAQAYYEFLRGQSQPAPDCAETGRVILANKGETTEDAIKRAANR